MVPQLIKPLGVPPTLRDVLGIETAAIIIPRGRRL
jgi:hypothetical protein